MIVEDGSIVANANSYNSRDDFIAYAADLGVTIADEEATDALLIEVAQFIDAHEPSMVGYTVERDQPMAWPRSGVVIESWSWGSDEIPRQVKLCQMAYALELNAGIDIYNPEPVKVTKRESVEGAVEVEYFGKDGGVKLSRNSRAKALLNSFLIRSGLMSIPAVRA